MRKWFGEFFYYSRGERRGILALLGIALLLFWGGEMYVHLKSKQADNPDDRLEQEQAMEEYRAFSVSIRGEEKEKKESWKSRYMAWEEEFVSPVLAPFNPNTADSATFRQLGLPAWMARNILRYREKGGVFRRAEDFRKIYGLTEEQYTTLRPYIRIPATDSTDQRPSLFLADRHKDSLQQAKPLKYEPGTRVDLNRADTTELKKIPGIGSSIARLISGYRQQLGGFYSLSQLEDIDLDYRQLADWFRIDTTAIRRIPVNRASVDRLRRHPYLNFYQAKALVEYRRKHGPLKSLKPLVLYEEFTREDLERIGHYLNFE
ncbi:MAG TPA: helix-hairpin-helix domain-containing protein [Candidatus Bacteroides merdavium]|uniref:Helix-hairpin-helix domain-containing protein n=1 Tax=Candidatus Bacteroides merdavium TaxID=2838472 RepID=A0A9D2GXP2_9BACE|nr:helix-hairpin-helix domain-containing protein [Candidatus Bacteroides merdavium]